jgi:hypothetical protein
MVRRAANATAKVVGFAGHWPRRSGASADRVDVGLPARAEVIEVRFRRIVAGLGAGIGFAASTAAFAADRPPRWLLGTFISLQYRESRSFEPVEAGNGRAHDDVLDARTEVRVNERGGIIARTRTNVSALDQKGGAAETRSFDWAVSLDSATDRTNWRFQGDMLYGFEKLGTEQNAAVKRIVVRFDRNAKTCVVTLNYARPAGAAGLVVAGWHDDAYYLRRFAFSDSRCELKSGDASEGAR